MSFFSFSVIRWLTENVKMTPIFARGITVTTQTGTIHRLRHVDFLIPYNIHCKIALIVSRHWRYIYFSSIQTVIMSVRNISRTVAQLLFQLHHIPWHSGQEYSAVTMLQNEWRRDPFFTSVLVSALIVMRTGLAVQSVLSIAKEMQKSGVLFINSGRWPSGFSAHVPSVNRVFVEKNKR